MIALVELNRGVSATVAVAVVSAALGVTALGHGVVPPGPYMLFVLSHTSKGLVPSVSSEVTVG